MTDRAEGGLWKEGGRELMALDIMDFGLFDGSPALVQGEKAFSLTVSQVLCIWGRGNSRFIRIPCPDQAP